MLLRALARQLGGPKGPLGRLVARVLNHANAAVNAKAVAALGVRDGDRVLDLGFGGGVGLQSLLASPAARVIGVERSADMLAEARRRFRAELEAGRLVLQEGSADSLPLGDDSVDRAVTVHTLYFWRDPAAGMRELRRALVDGGSLVVAIHPRESMEGQRVHRHGFRLYRAEELETLLRDAGFEAPQVRRDGDLLLGIASG